MDKPHGKNISDMLDEMQDALSKFRKKILELRRIDAKLNDVACGVLPSRICADQKKLAGMDDAEMPDTEFIDRLAQMAKDGDCVGRMLGYATIASRLVADHRRTKSRVGKLAERIRQQPEGPERQTAIALKARTDEAARVLSARIAATLHRFFEARLWALNATERITKSVSSLFTDGDEALRSAALGNSAKDAIAALGEMESRVSRGRMSATTTGKRRISI